LGPKKSVPLRMIEEKWTDLALPKEQFDDLVRLGSFGGDVEWNTFFALACSAVAGVSIYYSTIFNILSFIISFYAPTIR